MCGAYVCGWDEQMRLFISLCAEWKSASLNRNVKLNATKSINQIGINLKWHLPYAEAFSRSNRKRLAQKVIKEKQTHRGEKKSEKVKEITS